MEVGDGEGKKQEDRKGPHIATALPEAPPSAHHGLGADAASSLHNAMVRKAARTGPPEPPKGKAGPEPMSVRRVRLKELWVEGRRVETALRLAEARPPSESRRLRKCGLGQGAPPQGRGGACTLTYKQGMYTRLPTITSMNSSGEQSSRKSTSALKISEGLGLRAQCALAARVPSQVRA